MKTLFLMLLFLTAFAHADEIGSQYKKQAEAGDARAQYYLADTYFSSGDRKQAALWAEKAAKGRAALFAGIPAACGQSP